MECSIQQGKTFHLSPNENIFPLDSIAQVIQHYLFYVTCTNIRILNKFKRKKILKKKNTLAQAEQATPTSMQEVLCICLS